MGPIFENRSILKVLHGCLNSDIGWLQRDYGITARNVFDTQEAYKVLYKGQSISLTSLWDKYCDGYHKFSKEDKTLF